MNAAQTTAIESHVRILVHLLLGDRAMQPSLFFMAGPDIDTAYREEIAEMAISFEVDILHIAFRIDETGAPKLADIAVFLPRDQVCYSCDECVLTMTAGHKRAALVSPNSKGYFSVLPSEIVHQEARPASIDAGIKRAARRMNALLDSKVDVAAQASIGRFDAA